MNLYLSSVRHTADFYPSQKERAVPLPAAKPESFRKEPVRFGMAAAIPAGYALVTPNSNDTALLRDALEVINRIFQGDLEEEDLQENFDMLKNTAERGALFLMRNQSTGQIVGVAGMDTRNASYRQTSSVSLILYMDKHHSAQTTALLKPVIEKARTLKGQFDELRAFVDTRNEAELDLFRALGFEPAPSKPNGVREHILALPEDEFKALAEAVRRDGIFDLDTVLLGQDDDALQAFRLRL